MTNVRNENISFIIQGALFRNNGLTDNLIASIKEYFPRAKIVLSTWKGQDSTNLEYNRLVLNDDPGDLGSYYHDRPCLKNNCNRQIVSSINGLEYATTDFAIKIRSDMLFTNNQLIECLQKNEKCMTSSLLDKNLIVIRDLTVNPLRYLKLNYHPCDFLYAGRTSDLKKIFSCKQMEIDDSIYFEKKYEYGQYLPKLIPKYSNEQYLLVEFLKRYEGSCLLSNAFEYTDELLDDWARVIHSYFNMYSLAELGILCQKYPSNIFHEKRHVFTKNDFNYIKKHRKFKKLGWGNFDIESFVYHLVGFLKDILKSRK